MAVSKAHIKATNKWMAKAYDCVNLTLPKGQKEIVQDHAAAHGESTNAFIGRAIMETMERDGAGGPQEAAEAAGEGLPEFVTRAVLETAERDRLSQDR